MADTQYFTIVTDSGTKEMLKAVNEERKVTLIHFAVGDGGGNYYEPETTMTELKNEVWRGNIGSCKINEESENILIIEAVIPADEGGFTIREMAVFDDNNTMIAICNTPDTAKVRVTDGVVQQLHLQMEILLNNKNSVQLLVDPNIVTATKKDIQALQLQIDGMAKIVSIIAKYSYDEDDKRITNLLPFDYNNGTLSVPDGMGHFDGNKLVLTDLA